MALAKKKTPLEEVAEVIPTTPEPSSSMHAFEEELNESKADDFAPFSVSALGLAFNTVVDAIKRDAIPNYELVKILDVLPVQESTQEFDAEFDLAEEISGQLRTLKTIKNSIFSTDGRIKEGSSVKEAKDFMASSSQLLQMLQKAKAELINIDRMQAIEEATIETLRDLDENIIEEFGRILKEKLDRIR